MGRNVVRNPLRGLLYFLGFLSAAAVSCSAEDSPKAPLMAAKPAPEKPTSSRAPMTPMAAERPEGGKQTTDPSTDPPATQPRPKPEPKPSPDPKPAPDEKPEEPGASIPEPRPVPFVAPPVVLGTLAGPGMPRAQRDLRFYGTDLGISFEHRGELWMLFGDTWSDDSAICEADRPSNDDTVAILPREYEGNVPPLRYVTDAQSPNDFARIQLLRGEESLVLGYGQAPLAGFSDGERSFALFERMEPHHCDAAFATGSQACPTDAGFECAEDLGICEPAYLSFPVVCDAARGEGCLPGQECVKKKLCVDPTSSQNNGTRFANRERSVAHTIELGIARDGSPATYDSALAWPTNKFSIPAARTVAKFTGTRDGNDYGSGHGKLLLWGRPGLSAEHDREGHLYLMSHDLPLKVGEDGKLAFSPKYYAGIDSEDGQPIWSERESDAQGIALDGANGGDPHESVQVMTSFSVSWLGAPINKWVMLYGGDFADYLLLNPPESRGDRAPGSIWMRFADHPWGPFSPPTPHLIPGSPLRPNDPYGPGGYMYNSSCAAAGQLMCAPSDPNRPLDTALEGCPFATDDPGRLYSPNIIQEFTKPNDHGGLDVTWNVSTWNPYAVMLFRTSINPPDSGKRPLDEVADSRALARLSNWKQLPVLGEVRRYEQQSSYDRERETANAAGLLAAAFPLAILGNRDFNNFVCASDDAEIGAAQIAPFKYDLDECPEDYVRGAVLSRFEGAGHLVRMWIGMQSLVFAPADDEILRIYVDDDPRPRLEAPLVEVLDGRAGEIFAPPFGAGSPYRMSWYYPVSYNKKLIVALDKLGEYDNYFYHCDVVHDSPNEDAVPRERSVEREAALRQLGALHHPAGTQRALHEPVAFALGSGESKTIELEGPGTIHELQVQVRESDVGQLQQVRFSASWDGAAEPAIDVSLADLLGGSVPPEVSSLALSSMLENTERTLTLKLPMAFKERAKLAFVNTGERAAAFGLRLLGDDKVPEGELGYLHVQRQETIGPTKDAQRLAVKASGRGRLVGVCNEVVGHADPASGIQYDHLNLLEGDVRVKIDGTATLNGTGSEEYADDVFYFVDAPHANAFVQAWGVENDPDYPPGRASFCRWHVLGTELDFKDSLELTYELGGTENPGTVEQHKTIAYLYLAEKSGAD